jgi:SSS family solute:Na+ symporter
VDTISRVFVSGGLFTYLQSVQALISPPIAAVFLLGLFIKRINSEGAMAALYTGAVLGIARLVFEVYEIQNILTQPLFLHFALYLFLVCSGVMIAVSYMTPEPDYDKIKDIVFQRSSGSEKTNYFSRDAILTYILIACVFVIWYTFR